MSKNLCQSCQEVFSKENSIGQLLIRLAKALFGYFQKKTGPFHPHEPRFYCCVCEKVIPYQNVTRLATGYRSTEDESIENTRLGWSYRLTCHGQSQTYIETVASRMVNIGCHHFAFRQKPTPPERDNEAQKRYIEIPNDNKPAFERAILLQQKSVAEANAKRVEWDKKQNLAAKVAELQQLVNTYQESPRNQIDVKIAESFDEKESNSTYIRCSLDHLGNYVKSDLLKDSEKAGAS